MQPANKAMLVTIYFLVLLFLFVFIFLQMPQFGRLPGGERLKKIRQSPNYKNGSFQNLSHTPSLTEGASYSKVFKEFFFEKKERRLPDKIIPSVKTNLKSLDSAEDVLVWFGHSSYFMQIEGKRILVDPVFSGSASPLPFGTKAFKGTDIYTAADIPEIDYLFITHDHWDHLDYKTIQQLKPKIQTVICGLGVGEHFEHWGYDESIIIEKDWNEEFILDNDFTVTTFPARHFSGRGLARNKALWLSYILKTATMNIFIGGDSGYDTHFAEAGEQFGPFDLAILENGQYDANWRYIHLLPAEILQAAKELKAKKILPVHSSKFALGNHAWDEPLEKLIQHNAAEKLAVLTPMIGEKVILKENNQSFTHWWRNVQ
ncbi:MAG: MBL fold metallo-hydrolase [Lacibacter sp.]